MTERIDRWHEVANLFTERLGDVGADQWSAPTPCADWDVRALVQHAIEYQRGYLIALGAGGDVPTESGDDLTTTWVSVHTSLGAAYASAGTRDATFEFLSPLIPGPVAEQVIVPTADLLIHTWDLARAIGADETLPADTCGEVLAAMRAVEHFIRIPEWYAPAIEPPTGASAPVELLCFAGRAP